METKARRIQVGTLFLAASHRGGVRGEWHLANTNGNADTPDRDGHQRSRLQHRPRLPPPLGLRAHRHAPRVRPALKAELPDGARPPPARQHRAGGPCTGGHRPGHGGLHPLRQGARRGGRSRHVREALALINQTLDEALAEQEGDFDADSRWALAWFEQSGFDEGEYGVAETALQVQEHERRRHGRGWHPRIEARQGAAAPARGASRGLGPGGRPRASRAWEIVHH